MKQSSKLFSAFLLGAATGALLAPDKGSELRKELSKNANNLLDQLQDTVANGKGTFADLKEKIVNKASALKEEMSDAKMEYDIKKRKEKRQKKNNEGRPRSSVNGKSHR